MRASNITHICSKCNMARPAHQFVISRNLCRACNMLRHTQAVRAKRDEYLAGLSSSEKRIRARMAFLERHSFFKRTGPLADYSPSERKYQAEWLGIVNQLRDALPERKTSELKRTVLKSKLMDELEETP